MYVLYIFFKFYIKKQNVYFNLDRLSIKPTMSMIWNQLVHGKEWNVFVMRYCKLFQSIPVAFCLAKLVADLKVSIVFNSDRDKWYGTLLRFENLPAWAAGRRSLAVPHHPHRWLHRHKESWSRSGCHWQWGCNLYIIFKRGTNRRSNHKYYWSNYNQYK